ncbi:Zn(2)-C6 fungal-type domain-containing protein [Fusarium sp. LHS14.1]|nr:Zn(2)-C6 fungal-type domain-containing protein [Fusarium sp. LHS14.1]
MAGSDVSSRAPWKRSACDRCRAQKLRCHRDEGHSSDACLRCLKSGTECVTSKARPTGRPPSRQVQPTVVEQADNSSSSHTTDSSPVAGGADINMINFDYDLSRDGIQDIIGMQHSDFIMNDNILVDLPPLSSQSMNQHSVAQTQVAEPSSVQSASHQFDRLPRTSPIDPELPIRSDHVELLLSRLHSKLSGQLYSIRSAPWDIKGTLNLSLTRQSNDKGFENQEPHPLAQVSQACTELVRLLAGLRPSTIAERAPSTFSYAIPPRLRTTQLLIALSCYIQIVSIYGIIFSKVFEYLLNTSKTSIATYQSPPLTLYIGGLPIPPNETLSANLLVHLTEHQLHQIEQLMGLPEHYRVSSRAKDSKDGEPGLFGSRHSQSLLNAAIQLGEDRDGNHDDVRCVRALKVVMRQIKDF